jgi:RNase P/RNase MRP subunit POP5
MGMKIKRRYLLVESATTIENKGRVLFERALYGALFVQIGAIHYHSTNPKIVGFVNDKRFVVRASLEGHKEVALALAMIKKLDGTETAFYTLKSSGTIKALLKDETSKEKQ